MFNGTPDRPRRTVSSALGRRTSRSAFSPSGQSSRASPPPSQLGVASTPRAVSLGLHAASRALTASPAPSRRGPRSSVAPSDFGGSDVDESSSNAKTLVRDANYVVLEQKGLPMVVDEVLESADPYVDPFRAALDTTTGYAYLVSRETCYVWNWARHSAATTTYQFPLPMSLSLPANVSLFSPLCYAALVPTSTTQPQTREPGLIVVSTTGEVRYWNSVSLSLSGVDQYAFSQAPLQDNELVRSLTPRTASTFLLATSHARLLVVSLSSAGGRANVTVKSLDRPQGWAGSVWSAVFKGKPDPQAGILAVAMGPQVAYAIAAKSVQVWTMDEQGDRLAVELDLFAGVLEALKGSSAGNEEWALNQGKVDVLDARGTASGALAVLVSHVTDQTATNALSYAVAFLELGTTLNSLRVVGVKKLSYQAGPDPRPLSSPRLSLPGGDAAFVVFVDAVVMFSLSSASDFEEAFPLRLNTHRFLGASTPSTTASLTLLTSTSTLLSIEITGSLPPIETSEEAKTRKLKSKIEQAIFYGAEEEDNPLAFDLLPEFEGDLVDAAEAISAELLASSSNNLPQILDMRSQLHDRSARARGLIEYINSNGLHGKLSQTSCRRLSWDAEKLAAASSLWHYQNSRMGESDGLLVNAIDEYMHEIGEGFTEDTVRAFFRNHVAGLGQVLGQVAAIAKSSLQAMTSAAEASPRLLEANTIILNVFRAVLRFRSESAAPYGLDPQRLPSEAWSSTPSLLEALQWHFDSTDSLLRDRTRELGTSIDEEPKQFGGGRRRGGTIDGETESQQTVQSDFRKQMTELADAIFASYEERIVFLTSTAGDSGTSPELRVVTEKYHSLRTRILRTLVTIGKVPNAYDLAERYRDFDSLVELCNHPKHGSEARVKLFLDKYGPEYAFALYHYYVAKGELQVLLQQDEIYRPYLTQFLDAEKLSQLSWLNDIAVGRFDAATDAVLGEAQKETSLAEKRLLLSIGKLTQVAQATSSTLESEDVQRALEAVDDGLDLVNSQEELRELFAQALAVSDVQQLSFEEQGETVASKVAPSLESHPALFQLYSRFCSELLEGRSLSPEDLIDLLTYKEVSTEGEASDFSAALDILVRAKTLSAGRHQVALHSIWRRAYTRDDWAGLSRATHLRDEELADALRSTWLYATIASAAEAEHPASLYLQPQDSFFVDEHEALISRFPHDPPLADLLRNELEEENARLREALEQHRLDSFVEEIGRLLASSELAHVAMEDE